MKERDNAPLILSKNHTALKKLPSLIFVILLFYACLPEAEKFTADSNAKLRFSTDTIFFDTLFTTLGSVTRRLKVYNDAGNAVNISSVSLQNASAYSIFVNGLAGPEVGDVRILGQDSMLVLVEVTIDPQNQDLPFLVTDKIEFVTNGNRQSVDLVSWGQDANFLRDSILACNTTWTSGRPYVIYNSVIVREGCTLTLEPGTNVYSHNGSFILVGGTIRAVGEGENRITFTNDRFDEIFADAPGQWGGIVFLRTSRDNRIDFADIRNANVGIYLGTPDDDTDPDLVISNTRIENIGGNDIIPGIDSLVQPGFGILAFTSDLYAYNLLINNCEINALANIAGGNYRYEYCTFANFSFDFFRRDPIAVFSDNVALGDALLVGDLHVTMTNSIVWGNFSEELLFSNSDEAGTFSVNFTNNILRTDMAELKVDNFGEDPKFSNPGDYDYSLDTLSPAKDRGLASEILTDLEGKERDSVPDLGAFERIEN